MHTRECSGWLLFFGPLAAFVGVVQDLSVKRKKSCGKRSVFFVTDMWCLGRGGHVMGTVTGFNLGGWWW